METLTTTKIAATRIVLDRAEYPNELIYDIHAEFTGPDMFAMASRKLWDWSYTAPKDGGYDKTDVRIFYANGETYRSRFDLKHPSADNRDTTDITAHIQLEIDFYDGKRCPAHVKPEVYARYLEECRKDGTVAHYNDLRDNYQISD